MNYTLITLDDGVLSFHVEGEIEQSRWRALMRFGIAWLKAEGCGSLLVPHPCCVS